MRYKTVSRNPRSRLILGMISTDTCNQSSLHPRPGTHQIPDDETLPQTRVGSCSGFVNPEYTGLTKKILSTPLRLHDQMWSRAGSVLLCVSEKLNTYTAHESFLAVFVFAVDKAGQGTQIKKKEAARSGLQSSLPYLKIIIPASTQVQLIHVTTWKISIQGQV